MDREYQDYPLDREVLLSDARCCRALAECKCELFSGRKEAAAQRLIQYFRRTDRGHANARLLQLNQKELTCDEKGKVEKTTAEWDLAVQARLRDMVEQLENALEMENVDMTVFKPNHFATLSVYFAKLVAFEIEKPRNGLARFC